MCRVDRFFFVIFFLYHNLVLCNVIFVHTHIVRSFIFAPIFSHVFNNVKPKITYIFTSLHVSHITSFIYKWICEIYIFAIFNLIFDNFNFLIFSVFFQHYNLFTYIHILKHIFTVIYKLLLKFLSFKSVLLFKWMYSKSQISLS